MRNVLWICCLLVAPFWAHAHGYKAGHMVVDHPYALPTESAGRAGMVFFRQFKNHGRSPDRLVAAQTPVADQVVIHQAMPNPAGVPLMRVEPSVDLPPRTALRFRHNHTDGYHLMLQGLKRPLQVGDRFPMVLTFEQAGRLEVTVWVQQPRGLAGHHNH